MIKVLSSIFSIINNKDKKFFFYLEFITIVSCLFEVLNLCLIYFFIKTVIDPNYILNNFYINFLFKTFIDKIVNIKLFLFVFVISCNLISVLLSVYLNWLTSKFCERVHQSLSNALYLKHISAYGTGNFFGTFTNFSKLILYDLNEVRTRIIIPFILINQKFFLIIFLCFSILLYKPLITIISLIILYFSYLFLFKKLKKISLRIANKTNLSIAGKVKILKESFSGFREILLLGLEKKFYSQYESAGAAIEADTALNNILFFLPKLVIEFFAFCFVIIIIFIFSQSQENINNILPTLIIIGFVGLKIIPSLTQIYSGMMNIRIGAVHLNKIKKDFNFLNLNNLKVNFFAEKEKFSNQKEIQISKNIEFKNISLSYGNSNQYILRDLNFKFFLNKINGITGPSGSGKSSIIDLLLGFIKPQKGDIFFGNKKLNKNLMSGWRKNFFLVTHNIFISNSTLLENIAFGIDRNKIDINKIKKISKILHLDEIINKFPDKYLHEINDMGSEFSSGEKQRISLARALYFNKKILIMDEATNALDEKSEKSILKAIKKVSATNTIIFITHNISSLKICDRILYLSNGSTLFHGPYSQLIKKEFFR
jgi:HlyD family secretion protein